MSGGYCLAQEGDNVVYASFEVLATLGTGEACHNETAQYKFLPGTCN